MKTESAARAQRRWRSRGRVSLCAALMAGCGAGEDADDYVLSLQGGIDAGHARPASEDAGVSSHGGAHVADAGAPLEPVALVSVKANGTGCLANTWAVSIPPDGTVSFPVSFSSLEAVVDETTAVSVKDCAISVRVEAPPNLSFAVEKIVIEGYAYLEPGVRARHTLRYHFLGDPLPMDQIRADLVGPVDDRLVWAHEANKADEVRQPWSPCGGGRDLAIFTSLRLQNGTPRRGGVLVTNMLRLLKVKWRECPARGETSSSPAGRGRSSG